MLPARRMSRSVVSNTKNIRMNSTLAFKEDLNKGRMLRFQDSLPKMPIPTLEESAVKFLKSVRAVATPDQYAKTESAVKEFVQKDGLPLQKKLEERVADQTIKNWIHDWWNEDAYLAVRDPVVPYVSYFYSYKDDKLRKNPAIRAAAVTTGALSFKELVDSKTLEPEYMRKAPICMEAYKWMFNVCRVPVKEGVDEIVSYPVDQHKHIIVIRKNRFFKVCHEIDGQKLTNAELEDQYNQVYKLGDTHGPAIGALTSENRDKWADFRTQLLEAGNEQALEDIESASFIVCLDSQAPVTKEERAHQYWHGDGKNRFYDKPLQFIVNENGTAGFMGEHSMMDGTLTHRLNDYVNDVITHEKIELGTTVRSNLPAPQEVKFKINSKIEESIEEARKDFDSVIGEHELSVFTYQGYGKGLIKRFGASPDAYMQMLIQLAYYKCFGVSRPTYESAATRKYQLGRIETCRSVSEESVAFCKTMEDPAASTPSKIAAARKAIASHVAYISDASNSKGVDRHFFGLKKLLQPGQQLPALYRDPMFTYSATWYLSTSQLSSEYFNGYGWSQVIDQGFGCAYMINENSLQVNIVSKKQGSEKLKFYLNEAADDLAEIFSSEINDSANL